MVFEDFFGTINEATLRFAASSLVLERARLPSDNYRLNKKEKKNDRALPPYKDFALETLHYVADLVVCLSLVPVLMHHHVSPSCSLKKNQQTLKVTVQS